jgi:NAD(P)-dependent dehydrogenase (short-subunit alcohol dehydrogenase family)
MCIRFGQEGGSVVVADLNLAGATETAEAITTAGGQAVAVACDVTREADIQALVGRARDAFGPIDLFCSNAGIAVNGGPEAPDDDWERSWLVNTMAHVWAARAILPAMVERGEGYLLQTASAAGLLTNIGTAPYSVTKHAAVGLAEWIAITYGDRGIKVSCLCPQGVRTPMLMGSTDVPAGAVVLASGELLEPDAVAEAVIDGLATEQFLILPHPVVADYLRAKVDDYDKWLSAMRRLQSRLPGNSGSRD